MSHSFGFILEELECRAHSCNCVPTKRWCESNVDQLPEVIDWYASSKGNLRTAYERDCGVSDAAAEFMAARNVLGCFLDAQWPGADTADAVQRGDFVETDPIN
jgi:hypothetical protein